MDKMPQERIEQKGNLETYIGKVRKIGQTEVMVSLFQMKGGVSPKGEEEILGELPRGYFPQEGLEPGQVFYYDSRRRQVKMAPLRELTGEELRRLEDEVAALLPYDNPF